MSVNYKQISNEQSDDQENDNTTTTFKNKCKIVALIIVRAISLVISLYRLMFCRQEIIATVYFLYLALGMSYMLVYVFCNEFTLMKSKFDKVNSSTSFIDTCGIVFTIGVFLDWYLMDLYYIKGQC